jgi:peptidyl-prolyl cis-trans isomerase B (cyclophilin B)
MNVKQFFGTFAIGALALSLICASGCQQQDGVRSSHSENNHGPIHVRIATDFGDMVVALSDSTPQHRDNFVKLVEENFYDSLLFHRVISGFMIQGGDPNSKGAPEGARLGNGGPGYTIPAEFHPDLLHYKGALAAARQGDPVNPERRSSGSQFYLVQGSTMAPAQIQSMEARINASRMADQPEFHYTEEQLARYAEVGGTPFLDQQYTVFGQVIEGLEVIDSIAAVSTARGDRPFEDIRMTMEVVRN